MTCPRGACNARRAPLTGSPRSPAPALAAGPVAAAAPTGPGNPSEALELPTVVVIGTTALPGISLPLERVAGNVQAFTS